MLCELCTQGTKTVYSCMQKRTLTWTPYQWCEERILPQPGEIWKSMQLHDPIPKLRQEKCWNEVVSEDELKEIEKGQNRRSVTS